MIGLDALSPPRIFTAMSSRRRAALAAAAVFLAASRASAARPLLVCPSPNDDGFGYGGDSYATTAADLNAAAGGSAATTADLSDAAALLGYDGVWVDVRQPDGGTLSTGESDALSAYIATGRRVVLVGGNAAYDSWDASILGLVGGTYGTDLPAAAYATSATTSPVTTGVRSVYARGAGTAVGSPVRLFNSPLATVWGPARNVVVLLGPAILGDQDTAANAPFDNNLARWAAGLAADPTGLWHAPAGGAWRAGASWLNGYMPAVADDAVFNSSSPSTYTVTIDGSVTARMVAVQRDRVTLAGPGTVTVGAALTVAGGGSLSIADGASVAVGGATTVAAGSSLSVAGRLSVSPGSNRLGGLAIVGGQIDLTTAAAVVPAADVATVTAWAATAFAGGRWDGPGLTSSAAAADGRHLSAVGVVRASAGSFDGQPVTTADVLVRATVYGDANLDGVVTAADYTRLDAGSVRRLSGWANGDFNYDGTVDGSDYALADNAFNTGGAATPAAVAAVPEPAAPVAIVATFLATRRRRRSTSPPA